MFALVLALALLPLVALAGPVLWASAVPSNQGPDGFYTESTLATANAITVTEQSAAFTGWSSADLIAFTISCTEDSGTATLDVALQRSIDGGATWTNIIAMTQLAATGAETKVYADLRAASAQFIGDRLRVNYVVAGTGAYTCSAFLAGEGWPVVSGRHALPGGAFLVDTGAGRRFQHEGAGESMSDRQKAPDYGVYTLNGNRFRARKGDLMPPGATFEAPQAVAAKRAAAGAPENEAATGPAENQAAKAAPEKK